VTVAVVGAGLAGLRTCESLRARGYGGRIVLIGAEAHPPYSRPPLSKEVLRGEKDASVATLRGPEELAALELDLRLGRRAVALDVDGRRMTLDDDSIVAYDDVVIATGAQPRTVPGLEGAHLLRTIDDSIALRDRLVPGTTVAIVGAGFIGLEVAASARSRGCEVTVIDVLETPLARVLDPAIGAAVKRLHEEHGVTFRLGVGVTAVTSGRLTLTDGSEIDADAVVVGIGVIPTTSWLEGSGLKIDDGVVCDENLRAAASVWAVGDIARWTPPALGRPARLEHWTNATEQPDHVARAICGDLAPFDPVPYFWSDQYDAKLQSLGYAGAGDEIAVVKGSLDEPKWVALIRQGDNLAGVVGLRSPGPVMRYRPLLAAGVPWSQALAA
jgi:NADPH-dependent 2,4-dienoyl-CoA reductase/sulfur reductase-like enzyme